MEGICFVNPLVQVCEGRIELIQGNFSSEEIGNFCHNLDDQKACSEQRLRSRPSPVESRNEAPSLIRLKMMRKEILPRAMDVVRHTAENGIIGIEPSDLLCLLRDVFSSPWSLLFEIDGVEGYA